MSSALAMILAAGIAIPGDGPGKVSGEVEQELDLRGEWEGTLRNYHGVRSRFRFGNGEVVVINDQMQEVMGARLSFTDEGKGKVRLRLNGDQVYLGIYRQEGDRFFSCFSSDQRPTDFRLTKERCLIDMHRVKPRK
jgi:hypothetical protein